MQESTASLFESDDWHNGDSDLSDNAADFPVLANYDIGLQWAGLAYGLTRVLAAADGAEMAEWGERRGNVARRGDDSHRHQRRWRRTREPKSE